MSDQPGGIAARFAVFRIANFRRWWLSEGLSVLGGMMTLTIAMPWLALTMTDGDASITGFVFAVGGIPRLVLMLYGGDLADRYDPRRIIFISIAVRASIIVVLPVLILTGVLELWMLFVQAFLFGTADAFYFPAQTVMTPRVVGERMLPMANAAIMGTIYVSLFAGAALGGVLIEYGGRIAAGPFGLENREMAGITVSLLAGALLFAFSAFAVALVRLDAKDGDTEAIEGTAMTRMLDGFRFALEDRIILVLIVVFAGMNLAAQGAWTIGIAAFARDRFVEGAAAYGYLEAAMGVGAVVGIVAAGILPRPARPGPIFMSIMVILGVQLGLLVMMPDLTSALAVQFFGGIAEGYISVMYTTWLQTYVPSEYLGRVSALLMMGWMGFGPISQAATGPLLDISINGLFIGAALAIIAIGLGALLLPVVRNNPFERPGTVAERELDL